MINLSSSTREDVPQLNEWIQVDPYHKHQGQPEWWLTGGGLLSFCLMDNKGPLAYVRLDDEGEYVRINTQFGPESIVSKRRLVVGMLQCMSLLTDIYKTQGKKGFVFESISPTLITFMSKRQGFSSIGGSEYRVDFEAKEG